LKSNRKRTTALSFAFGTGSADAFGFDPGELTGVLTPLHDVELFIRVYIDGGTLAWSGDIDLTPDAIYSKLIVNGTFASAPGELTFVATDPLGACRFGDIEP
jgi:hypothetical protein